MQPLSKLRAACVVAVIAGGAMLPGGELAATERSTAGWRLARLVQLLGVPVELRVERPEMVRTGEVHPGLMTLPQSLDFGLAFNVDAQIAAAQETGQRATGRAAWRQLGPKLDLRLAEGYGEYRAISGRTPSTSRGDRSLSLRQPIFDWSAYHEALRQEANIGAAEQVRTNAQSVAALEAGDIYLSTLQSQLIVGYTAEYEQELRRLLRYMENRAGAGGASASDLQRVRGRVENIRASVSENRAGLITNLTQFARLVGRLPERIAIPPSLGIALPETEREAVEAGLSGNHDLRGLTLYVDAARLEMRAQNSRFIPRVDLEISRVENRNPSGSEGLQSDTRGLVILSWNLFNSGADLAQRDALMAKRQETSLRVLNAERRLRQQLENTYSVLDSIRLRFDAVRQEVDANRIVVTAFNEQLFTTNRQLLDVLDAYQRLYQSKVDLTNLLVTEAKLQLEVAHLLGRLQPALGRGAPASVAEGRRK